MLTAIAAIIIGFIGLIWSADRFVSGAAGIARSLGMTPVMIGLTIVALGTSSPEIIVAINAAMEEASELAVGNAIGSNLANIGLVLGLTALVSPIPIAYTLLKREIPLLIIATVITGLFLYDNSLDFIDGVVFLLMLTVIFLYLIINKSHQPDAENESDVEHIPDLTKNKAWLWFSIGLILLIASSDILVWGAKDIAQHLGVSQLIIGLTVIAVGTSLPELAATIASAIKGHHDIALGNVVGSNLFNLLAVMAMPALISPTSLATSVFQRDYLAMLAITLLLVILLFCHKMGSASAAINTSADPLGKEPSKHPRIGRAEGALLLLTYAIYYYMLFSPTSFLENLLT